MRLQTTHNRDSTPFANSNARNNVATGYRCWQP